LGINTEEFINRKDAIRLEDERFEEKLDFMYQHGDYDSERYKIREKFLKETGKRVNLDDIGETLDDMVLANKAKYFEHYEIAKHHNLQPERPTRDYTSQDFQWSGKLMKSLDPKTPLWIFDEKQLQQ